MLCFVHKKGRNFEPQLNDACSMVVARSFKQVSNQIIYRVHLFLARWIMRRFCTGTGEQVPDSKHVTITAKNISIKNNHLSEGLKKKNGEKG